MLEAIEGFGRDRCNKAVSDHELTSGHVLVAILGIAWLCVLYGLR